MEAQSVNTNTVTTSTDEQELSRYRAMPASSSWVRGFTAFRGFISCLLIAALVVFVCILLLKDNLNEQIRTVVEKKLNEAVAETNVSVSLEGAEFRRGNGIRLTGLKLTDGVKPLLSTEVIFIRTPAEVWELIGDKVSVDSVQVTGLKLYAQQNEDQSFNVAEILKKIKLPKPKQQMPMPRISLLNASIQCQLSGGTKSIDVNLPAADIQFDDQTKDFHVRAKLISSFFHAINLNGEFSTASKSWRAWGDAKRFSVTPEIYDHLPKKLREESLAFRALKARLDFDFDLKGNTQELTVPTFAVTGKVSEGSVRDQRLPFPINGVTARFEANNSRVKIDDVIVESPIGRVDISFKTDGLTTSSPFELIAKINPLYVDQRLGESLPPEARDFLRKFSPQGNLSLNAKLSFQNGRWVPDVQLDLLDMSFAFHKCPYPIRNARGRVTLDAEQIVIDIDATASGRKVKFEGKFLDPGPNSHGRINVILDGQIPIDRYVFQALAQLPDISRSLQEFNPRGSFGFGGSITRLKGNDGKIHEDFFYKIFVHDVELNYDHFPLPFKNVYGVIEATPNKSTFRDFRGLNVGAETFARGRWTAENGLDITIESSNVELNNSLKSALPKVVHEPWDGLNPSGALGKLHAHITKKPRQPVDFVVNLFSGKTSERFGQVDRLPTSTAPSRQINPAITINPTWFPYELKQVDTHVEFRPDRFVIHSLKGKHRKSNVSIRGDGSFGPNGWACNLQRVYFDRLLPSEEFTSALPKALGDSIEAMEIDGMLNVGGNVSFKSETNFDRNGRRIQLPLETRWDLTADIDSGSILCGVLLDDIYGAIRLVGNASGEQFRSMGGIDIDSLVWNDIQLKNIRSPIYLDQQQALLGLWATAKQPNARPESITCNLFGGKLAANAKVSLHGKQAFEVQGTLKDADLKQFTFELAPGYSDVAGRAFGGFRVTGDNTGTHSLRGQGEVDLVDAAISEVPVMLGMLKLLSVKQIDRTLFNESKIIFRIEGEHVLFDDLEFLGDAISLKGNGEMDFDQNIELQFYTAVGRDGFRIPLLSPLIGAASQQILVIDVNGKTHDPKIKKNFFKMLNKKLKENIDDLEDTIEEGGEAVREAAEKPFGDLFR